MVNRKCNMTNNEFYGVVFLIFASFMVGTYVGTRLVGCV